MDDNVIKYRVMPTLFWLIFLMFAGAKLVSAAIEGAFGVEVSQLVISTLSDPLTLILILALYLMFFLLAYLTASNSVVSFLFASLFAIVCGAGLFSTVFYAADIVGAEIVSEALFLSAGVFFIAMVWQWVTKKDLINWGFWLLLLLLAAVFLTIAEVFINVTIFRLAVDIGVVLLFAFMVAYDTYWARQHTPNIKWMLAALNFFMDFMNILIRIIVILMESKSGR